MVATEINYYTIIKYGKKVRVTESIKIENDRIISITKTYDPPIPIKRGKK